MAKDQREWQQIESLIDKALELERGQRQDFIRKQCNGDEQLFSTILNYLNAIENSEGYLEDPTHFHRSFIDELATEYTSVQSSFVGEAIAGYTITELIEHGGMGSVYLAERTGDDFEQQVAVKIIRQGMDTPSNIGRFKREQQILANLHHPNIAQMYDGGITDNGLPYLIMEYVEGTPIDTFCDRRKCTIEQRVALFKQVCLGIQHAHKNLVIHRDLKPSNILVTDEGHVKILDFGISKMLEHNDQAIYETRERRYPVSLGYAAPEQLAGKAVTTEIDTYGLGVVLYQLLAGVHPFDLENKSIDQIEHIIRRKPVQSLGNRFSGISSHQQKTAVANNRNTSPEKLLSHLKSDLNAIVLKTLHKEPELRYSSVAELLDDIERFEKNLPVKAKPYNIRYSAAKFLKRHRKGLSMAAVFLSILVGLATFFTHKIAQERNQAEQEAAKAEQISKFTLDIFESNNPAHARGDTITVQQVLKQAEDKIDNLDEEPLVKSRFMLHIGKVYFKTSQPLKAQTILQEARDIQKKYSNEPNMSYADILLHLGLIQFHFMQNNDRAETLFKESMDIAERLSETDHISYYQNMEHLGAIQRQRGNFDSTKVLYDRAEAGYKQYRKKEKHHTYNTSGSRSILEKYSGNLEKAQTSQRQFLEQQLDEYGEDHPSTINAMDNLAATLRQSSRFKEAAMLYDRAIENAKQIWGKNSLDTASILIGIGINLKKTGRYDSAETHYKKALQIRKEKLGKDHPDLAIIYNNLGTLNSARENWDAALRFHNKSLSIKEKWYGKNHLETAHNFMNLGYLHKKNNQLDSALTYFKKAHKIREENLSKDHPEYAESLYDLGAMYGKRKEWEKSKHYLQRALEIQRQELDSNHPDIVKTYYALGLLMEKTERYEKAKPYYKKVLDIRKDTPGNDFTNYENTAERLAVTFQKTGQQTEADSLVAALKK